MRYYNTDYEIYEDGKCYSYKSNKYLTPQMTVKYPTYNLSLPEGKKKVKVHRMVAEMFLPPIESKNIVNHKDGNTHNFHVNNLEWVTAQENSNHAINMGLKPKSSTIAKYYDKDYENEIWKPVKNFPNYLVSSQGRIMNKRTQRLLKLCESKGFGYYEVNLWKEGKGHTTRVHKIVYSTFNEDYDLKGYVINHKDGNKLNNNIDNLEKVTYQENNLHAEYVIKTHKASKKIAQYDLFDNFIKEFNSINEATRLTGINNIGRAARQNRTAGGYKWKYI